MEKSSSHARARRTGLLGQRFPAHESFLREELGNWAKLQYKNLLLVRLKRGGGDKLNLLQRHTEPSPSPLSLSLPPPPFSTVAKHDIEFATVITFKHISEWY